MSRQVGSKRRAQQQLTNKQLHTPSHTHTLTHLHTNTPAVAQKLRQLSRPHFTFSINQVVRSSPASIAAIGVRIYRAGLHVNGQLTRHLALPFALTGASSERDPQGEGTGQKTDCYFSTRVCHTLGRGGAAGSVMRC